jgi:hypothetical protein
MKYIGTVEHRLVARGSKSERIAIVLVSGQQTHVLRRRQGNSFQDSVLDSLVGKTLEVEGDVHDEILHADYWKVVSSP